MKLWFKGSIVNPGGVAALSAVAARKAAGCAGATNSLAVNRRQADSAANEIFQM